MLAVCPTATLCCKIPVIGVCPSLSIELVISVAMSEKFAFTFVSSITVSNTNGSSGRLYVPDPFLAIVLISLNKFRAPVDTHPA